MCETGRDTLNRFMCHSRGVGLERLRAILDEDVAGGARIWESYSEFPRFAAATANFLYAILFKVTGIHDMGARFAHGAALSIPDTVVRNAYIANSDAIQVAMVGTQLFGIRLATLLMATPLVALSYFVAMTDGLVQRAVRRASGGRESGSLYHRAKHLQVMGVTTCSAVALVLPFPIDPRWLYGAGLVVVVLARLQWAYYKKHL